MTVTRRGRGRPGRGPARSYNEWQVWTRCELDYHRLTDPDRCVHMNQIYQPFAGIFCACIFAGSAFAAPTRLTTVAEQSGFLRTGHYSEVIALCDSYARAYPKAVRCIDFGTTPEGRPMKALIASRTGALTPEAVRKSDLPVLLLQGGIHAGEIDGKDAGFLALRELLDNRAAPGALDKMTLVFVPVFNVDGHERFGRWNRPNQRGPEEMGWRVTGQNLNLNRDYVKADAPEMQAMLRLINAWDPAVYVDMHVTDGAQFQHDVSITLEPAHSGDAQLQKTGASLRDSIIAKLGQQGSHALPFYPSFVVGDDPSSGFADGVAPPRFSTGYMPLRNRIGILVETHSWKDYPTRVRTTRNTIIDLIELAAGQGRAWLQTEHQADARAIRLGGTMVAQSYAASDKVRTIDFLGYEYTRTPSKISGALMTHYDETKPQIWHIPLRYDVQPAYSVAAPTGGYLVPAAYAAGVAQRLKLHGINFRIIRGAQAAASVETFRASKATFASQPFEGHTPLTLEGEWKPESRDIGAGALFVPIAQPKARLVMAILEPKAPDSLASWGEFNGSFEQKEYMEDYVAEQVAREQIAADPKLADEFERKLKAEPEFAKDPQARLQFFYQRHSSWDERMNLYPVMRTAVVPQ